MRKITSEIMRMQNQQRRRAVERWTQWVEAIRRIRIWRIERVRRRNFWISVLLALLQAKPLRCLLISAQPTLGNLKKTENRICSRDMRTDDERRFLYDYAPRRGEEHLEVMDGLTQDDIDSVRGKARFIIPRIEDMPDRYSDEPVLFATLIDHMASQYHRPEAFQALSLIAHPQASHFIEKCRLEAEGLSWKSLRMCKRENHVASMAELIRAAEAHEEMLRREIEEAKEIGEVESSLKKMTLK